MAAVRYRNRRRLAASAAPASYSLTPSDPNVAQAQRWSTQLTLANATEALRKLADGHTDEFFSLAQHIKDTAVDPADKTYWTELIDHAHQKLTEDSLVAQVNAGTKSLEDYKTYLNGEMKTAGTTSGRYPDLVKQLGDVTHAIYARDFNAEVNAAQAKLVDTGDRAGYVKTLSELVSRSRSADATAALNDRITQVRSDIQKEQITSRASEANARMIQYVEGKIGKGEIQTYLEGMAKTALTPDEAAKYTTLATQIDTRERTLARQALSDAASAGTKAIQAALDPYKTSYGDADTALVTALRTTADRGAYATFQTEAQDYADALRKALPYATSISARTTLDNTLHAVLKNIAERDKQMAGAVVQDAKVQAADLRAKANAASEPDVAAQYRYLATQLLQKTLADPLLANNDDQKQAIQTVLGSVANDHAVEIRKQANEVAANQPGGDKFDKAVTGVLNQYRDWVTTAAGAKEVANEGGFLGVGGHPASLVSDAATFSDLMIEGMTSGDISHVVQALGLDPSSDTARQKVASLIENYRQATTPLQAAQQKAQTQLEQLMAPRGQDGLVVDTSPAALAAKGYAGGGRVVPGFNAPPVTGANAFGKPAPAPDASVVPPDQQTVDPRLASMLGGPTADQSAPQGPDLSGSSGGPDTATFDALANIHGDAGARDPFTMAEDRAFSFLERQATLDLPNYDLPDMPDLPDFGPRVRDVPPIDLSPAATRSAASGVAFGPSPASDLGVINRAA